MLTPSFQLKKSQIDDLRSICSIGPEKLGRLVEIIDRAKPTIRPTLVRKLIENELGAENAKILSHALFGLANVNRRFFDDASELVEHLTKSLASQFDDEQMASWVKCCQAITDLINAKSVMLSVKATDLAADFDNTCVGTRFVTDIRPVFDDGKETIVGVNIIQLLRLEYLNSDTEKSITIALNNKDIRELLKSCESALRKAEVAQKLMLFKPEIDAIMSGEEEE